MTFPAATEGWDAQSPLANMPRGRAVQLTNWFPQPGFIEIRKGCNLHAWDIGQEALDVSSINTGTDVITMTASHGWVANEPVKVQATTTIPAGLNANETYYVRSPSGADLELAQTPGGAAVDITSAGAGTITLYSLETRPNVETLMAYEGPGSTQEMFAAAGGSVWDVSTSSYATHAYGYGLTNARWQYVNFATSAGNFIIAVNGADNPFSYNGTTFDEIGDGAAPDINIDAGAKSVTSLIQVTAHKGRLWFVEKESTNAIYMDAAGTIGGNASTFPLGSIFTKGGKLQRIVPWTLDGGSGPDDYLAFISSRGQVAIYQGTDPSSASTWSIIGVFDIGEPIGDRCSVKYGARPLIITTSGLLEMQLSLTQDKSQLEATSYTARIYNAMTESATSYRSNFGWQAISYPRSNMLLLNIPTSTNTAIQYVQNVLTGSWCEFEGWNAYCLENFNDRLYMGTTDGQIFLLDEGSSDYGTDISAVGQTAYSDFGSKGKVKRWTMLKALVQASGSNRPSIGISSDFVETFNLSTLTSASSNEIIWGAFTWGSETWPQGAAAISDWTSSQQLGTWGSIKFTASTGGGVGGATWGHATWSGSEWGGTVLTETMQINGFVSVFEAGEYF